MPCLCPQPPLLPVSYWVVPQMPHRASCAYTPTRRLTDQVVVVLAPSINRIAKKEDVTKGTDETEQLKGHYLRGWSGSLAYDLAHECGASWDGTEGADRARHTMESFFKNYYRKTVARQKQAFMAHPHHSSLRLEEAMVL